MKCPQCKLNTDTFYSAVVNGEYLSDRCNICIGKHKQNQPASSTRVDYRIRRQQEDHRKDMVQPWSDQGEPNPDFVKAYPERASSYYSQDQINKARRA